MGIFNFLGKKEVYNLDDGREIIIIDKSKTDYLKITELKQIILKTCSVNKIAKRFKRIMFYIEPSKKEIDLITGIKISPKDYKAWVESLEIKAGKVIVHINFGEEINLLNVPEWIAHELGHIWQMNTLKQFDQILKSHRLLLNSIKKRYWN